MDENRVLIYQYSTKNHEWYDATKDISWYQIDRHAWHVRFLKTGKYLHISFEHMKIYESPKEIEFAELYYKDSPCFKVKKLVLFNNVLYKIFYENGYTRVALANEIKIIRDTLKESEEAKGIMAYYRRVVQETAQTEEERYLLREFDDINYINENSVLALYLNGKLGKSDFSMPNPVISPFGINLSQSKALKMMFNNRISIVEGPPGTGKTQTILNFIANAIINKKSVAVVSNNNSATDNVYEKLHKNGYSFVAAQLGNSDNVDKFFEESHRQIPKFKFYHVDASTISSLYEELPKHFERENEKKKLNVLLSSIELEYKHFLADNSDSDFEKYKFNVSKIKSQNVLETIVFFKENTKKIGFFKKLSLRRKIGIRRDFLDIDNENIINLLTNCYYQTKINEIKTKIQNIETIMNNESFDDKIKTYTNYSKSFFEDKLTFLFTFNSRETYERDNYKTKFQSFVRNYPVVLSSTYSLAKCTQRGFLFDYLIVDESSQVNMASAILSMRVAKNIIVVGDTKQLPQIDDDDFKERNEELLNYFKVNKTYSYYGNSILSSFLSLYGDRIPRTLLKEHYRCNPDIISFCNKRFYNNELVIYTKPKDQDYSMKVIKTVEGNFARKNPNGSGLYNQREIDEIAQLLNTEKLEDVGVIAPYRYHTEVLSEQFGGDIEASTIHKFQGREKKTIIFSSVINDCNEFVENDNLINVAVSRAVDKFILVTSDKVAKSNSGVLSDLVNYISYHNNFGVSEEGTVKSIYDYLYEDYQEQLEKFRAKHPSKDFDSENLTKELIKNILSNKKYASFGLRMHVSLKDFINLRGIRLPDDEYKFFRNPNSHADFLIYNKMSKKPVLVIEVDGVTFHEQQKEQLERDAKKNSILEKVGIKILRLKTNESAENLRIKSALDSVL